MSPKMDPKIGLWPLREATTRSGKPHKKHANALFLTVLYFFGKIRKQHKSKPISI
jgi:hypothetical protein